jgi:hypothetical protein
MLGVIMVDKDTLKTRYLSEDPGILEVQGPIENLEKFANKAMKYLTLRSALFSDVQSLWKELLQCVIAVAKTSMTSKTLPGLLVRFVCFCNTHVTLPPSQGGPIIPDEKATTFRREIQDILRSFAIACGMDSEDYTTQQTEHTVLHSFLSTSPQSIFTLSKSFEFPSYSQDLHYTPSITMLRAGVDKWYPKNSLLNLELASQLFQLWDMKDKDEKDKRGKGKEIDKNEEKKIYDLLHESYSCAVIAAGSAFNRLQLSLPESGTEIQDLSLEGKKEMADVLCVEPSAAPRIYQEATELVYRIDRIRVKRAPAGGGGGEAEEVAQEANVLPSDSYRQYLRGIHWMPSLVSYAYLK